MNYTTRKDILMLLLVSTLLFVLNLWGYPLFDVDEPRYAETAREMLTDPGDWITPHFNWRERFDKPALFYWLIAGSYKLFGVSEFSARLVSALAATAIVIMLYAFIANLFNRRAGFITALIFATMIEVFIMARWSITDMALTCFMAGTWLSLFLVLVRSPRWYLLAGLFAGLGMLTKGPVAVLLPGLTLLIAIILKFRHKWKLLFSPWILVGLEVFLIIALPWYVAVAKANPEEFVGKFFFLHNVERFTGTVSGHSGPWYYYIIVILAGTFPWILFAPALIREWFRNRSNLPEFLHYANIWFWVVFLFFSFSGTKLLTYVLPAYPALAMLIGWYWFRETWVGASAEERRKGTPWVTVGLWITSGLLLVLFLIMIINPFLLMPEEAKLLFRPIYAQIGLLFMFLVFFIAALRLNSEDSFIPVYVQTNPILNIIESLKSALYLNIISSRLRGFSTLNVGLVLFFVYVNMFILPEIAWLRQADLINFARRSVRDNAQLAIYDTKKTSLVFYTQSPILHAKEPIKGKPVKKNSIVKKLLSKRHALYLIVRNRDISRLKKNHPVKLLKSGHLYSLFLIDKDNPGMRLVLFR